MSMSQLWSSTFPGICRCGDCRCMSGLYQWQQTFCLRCTVYAKSMLHPITGGYPTIVYSLISVPQTFSDFFYVMKVCEETVCAVYVLYIYFLKMCLVWKYGEYNKSYERRSKKCPLEVLSIFTFGIVGWRVGKIAADFYPQVLKNRLLQPVYLLRIVTQLVEMLACLLPCSGVTDKWHLSHNFYAGPLKWRENNGAKMTSRSRKKFPVLVSETKLVKITLPCFKS